MDGSKFERVSWLIGTNDPMLRERPTSAYRFEQYHTTGRTDKSYGSERAEDSGRSSWRSINAALTVLQTSGGSAKIKALASDRAPPCR